MAPRPHRPAQLCGRFFRGSDAVRLGLLSPDQLRGNAWRRIFHNVYVDAAVPDSHLLRCRAAALILPRTTAVTGRSAACLAGLPLGERDDPVCVVQAPDGHFRAQGFAIRRATLLDSDVVPGRPNVTTRPRTAWEIAREPDLVEAVVALDVLLGRRYVRDSELASLVTAHPRSRGARAIALADGRAESPQETRARVRIVLAGFPPPTPQYKLWVDGQFVARLDLAWPQAKVACEYDGEWHSDWRQLRKDRARLNKIVDAGWVVLHLTAPDLSDPVRFERFLRQLRALLDRR
jgi:hypothetical protein